MKKNNIQEKDTKLEKEILKKVYGYEAKKTYQTILIVWIIFMVLQFFVVLIGGALYAVWKEQQTLDLFQLFGEDFDVIRENIMDVLYVFYIESPQLLLFSFVSVLLGLLATIFFTVRNFKKIKNKLSSINKFFTKK